MSDFDRFASSYEQTLDRSLGLFGDTSVFFADAKAQHVARQVPEEFGGKVLDFGCGIGLLASCLRRHLPAAVVHGYDPSSKSIENVDAALRAHGRFTSDLRNLDDDYDVIVVANVLHHMPRSDRFSAAVELVDRLKVGGKLIVFEHNPLNPITRWVVSHCPFDREAVLLFPDEAIGYLHQAGICIVGRAYITFFPRLLGFCRPVERLLTWCPLGAQYRIIGQKSRKEVL